MTLWNRKYYFRLQLLGDNTFMIRKIIVVFVHIQNVTCNYTHNACRMLRTQSFKQSEVILLINIFKVRFFFVKVSYFS